eukprot:6126674-Amphidinium_carterae.1
MHYQTAMGLNYYSGASSLQDAVHECKGTHLPLAASRQELTTRIVKNLSCECSSASESPYALHARTSAQNASPGVPHARSCDQPLIAGQAPQIGPQSTKSFWSHAVLPGWRPNCHR